VMLHTLPWAQEHYRLGTFVEFPRDCPVSALALARAGFVYTGEGDKVKCFSCHVTVEGWELGDSAIDRHKNLSPDLEHRNEFFLPAKTLLTYLSQWQFLKLMVFKNEVLSSLRSKEQLRSSEASEQDSMGYMPF
uniref:RING-type E3 ubiquitin transferase n=1 Tax=Pavo cristatus TaxID=9049 RepID=A0A8C9FLU8_PAVCR